MLYNCLIETHEEGNNMKIKIIVSLYTDGDYGFAYNEETGGAFYQDYGLNEDNHFRFVDDYYDSQTYVLAATFEDENYVTCKYEAQHFLSKVFCNIRVVYTHWYIMEYIFKMFNDAKNNIHWLNEGTFEMSGNYEGTCIKVEIEE